MYDCTSQANWSAKFADSDGGDGGGGVAGGRIPSHVAQRGERFRWRGGRERPPPPPPRGLKRNFVAGLRDA
ncbi:hypothetical protein ALC56_03182 [Trachymyrmex septentrionalis]|uniref:Uncharacterized protein n=1 Tax=Trachymyrmex septentrionalis TaxID=34720 RepID=A0A151JZW3_9HYME|nr:hypothetical protein ALC56_03182 [Trachymyrmex septentrionalis]